MGSVLLVVMLQWTKLFYMSSRMTESCFALLRYTYSLKVHQANTPFSLAMLCHFNPQSSIFGSNISLSTLNDKNGFTVDEQFCNRIKCGAREPGFTQQEMSIF